jgi:hypothetical protein
MKGSGAQALLFFYFRNVPFRMQEAGGKSQMLRD